MGDAVKLFRCRYKAIKIGSVKCGQLNSARYSKEVSGGSHVIHGSTAVFRVEDFLREIFGHVMREDSDRLSQGSTVAL